jgi:hypothetical protein
VPTRYPHNPNVDLWNCPCNECTRYDWEALPDPRPSLAAHRRLVRTELAALATVPR